ncbi:hypothetical protein GCK32_009181, partial [Trichostrongylus colubriformis]
PTAVVASNSDWSSPPRRRSISTVCGPSHREINQFYAQFFPDKEIPHEYGVYNNTTYMNHTPHQNIYFGFATVHMSPYCVRCGDSSGFFRYFLITTILLLPMNTFVLFVFLNVVDFLRS